MSSVPALRTTDLIGRDAELEELTSQLGIRASEGVQTVRAMLLAGDAGVGKTRLLMALRDAAIDADWQVVAGHCLDLADSSLPYLPFSEILGRLMADQPDVAARVLEQHPTLARLQPGRRHPQQRDRVGRPGPRPRQRLRRVRRPPRRRRRTGAPSSSSSRTPTGPTSPPATCSASSSPAPFAGRRARRVLPRRRPPPPPPAPPSGRRVDAAARRRAAPGRAARRRRRTPPRPCAPPVHAVRGGIRLHRRPRRGQPVLHRGARRRRVVRDRSPASSPTCCWSTSTASTSRTRRVVRLVSRRRAARSATACWPPSPTSTPPSSRPRCAPPSTPNVLVASRGGTYAFRHALLGEAVYDDLLPGERMRLHAAFVAALDEGARDRHRCRARPARPPCRRPAGRRPRLHRGRRGGARRRRPLGGGHPLPRRARAASTPPARRCPTSTPSLWSAGAPRRSIASGRVPKAVKVLRARLAALPAEGASDVDRGQLLTALASALLLTDTTESPARDRGRGRRAAARRPAEAAGPRAPRPRPEPGRAARRRGADRGALQALELAERNDLTSLAVELHDDRRRARPAGRCEPRALAGGPRPSGRAAPGSIEPELRALYLLGRLHHDEGDLDAGRRGLPRGDRARARSAA